VMGLDLSLFHDRLFDASIGSVLVAFMCTASYGRTIFSIPPDLFTA
jgi:hypothetical protein